MDSNIQVVVRCRGRNVREIQAKSPVMVELPSDTFSSADPSITVNQNQQVSGFLNSMNSKTYTVDQIYGSQADQQLLFEKVAMPLFQDFLNGINVTILAYGQTGTGKTYTMCGNGDFDVDLKDSGNEEPHLHEQAGIIPRVLGELFSALDRMDSDYVVKCSFIELYNEELKDLLNDDSERNKLRMFELKRPVYNSLFIQNLQEKYINSTIEGLSILQKGLMKRKTASTKLNDVSSRSHTIFTINLYKKGENELFKVSKINLADLAGSENINRSGAVNQRAKEAGLINQSLLTLGRVINSLSEKSTLSSSVSHIPYRESKLTRLLQDSIGGKTKTTLIATISPAKMNLEETISTLEYASRAKNIQNKPQLGQECETTLKKILLKDMSKEITKLNNELIATRSKNGIWMDEKNYQNLIDENELLKADLTETKSSVNGLQAKIEQLSEIKRTSEIDMKKYRTQLQDCDSKIKDFQLNELNFKRQMEYYEQQVNELNDQIKKVNEDYRVSELRLNKIVQEGINSVTSQIDHIITDLRDSRDDSEEKITNTMLEFEQKLQKNKDSLTVSTNLAASQIEKLLQHIPSLMNNIVKGFSTFRTEIRNHDNKVEKDLSRSESLNNALSSYIEKDHLQEANLNLNIERIISEKINDSIVQLKEAMIAKLKEFVDTSCKNQEHLVKDALHFFSDSIITSEKKNLTDNHDRWRQSTNKIHNVIGEETKELCLGYGVFEKKSSDLIKTTAEDISSKLSTVVNADIKSVSAMASKIDLKEDIPTVRATMGSVLNKDAHLCNSWSALKTRLGEIQAHATKDHFQSLPASHVTHKSSSVGEVKSPSHSISPRRRTKSPLVTQILPRKSPLKRLSTSNLNSSVLTLQKSKIPQLQRLNSDKENITADLKRRRIEDSGTVND